MQVPSSGIFVQEDDVRLVAVPHALHELMSDVGHLSVGKVILRCRRERKWMTGLRTLGLQSAKSRKVSRQSARSMPPSDLRARPCVHSTSPLPPRPSDCCRQALRRSCCRSSRWESCAIYIFSFNVFLLGLFAVLVPTVSENLVLVVPVPFHLLHSERFDTEHIQIDTQTTSYV